MRPPAGFKVVNDASGARFTAAPPFATRRGATGARRAGLHYEARALDFVEAHATHPAWAVIRGPWIEWNWPGSKNGKAYAQPDGIAVNVELGRVVVLEMKAHLCVEAWWQLVAKYRPLVAALFPEKLWEISLVCVAGTVSSLDMPETPAFVRNWEDRPASKVGVYRLSVQELQRARVLAPRLPQAVAYHG